MLESIQISNFAIIESLDLELDDGMTALTGETGAGKSIILDAIKLVAGDRADSDSIKSGRDRAEISVRFNLKTHLEANQWLENNEMSSDFECVIRRVLSSNGRSKSFINGFNATLTQLKDLCQMLVDIHGQHEHQSLQKNTVQQQLLDAYLVDQTIIATVKEKYKRWRGLAQQLQDIKSGALQREQRIDLLMLYCDELNQLDATQGEIEALQAEYNRLSHAGQLLETTGFLLGSLYDNDENTIQSRLSQCEQLLNDKLSFDAGLATSHELITNALILVQEATGELRSYEDSVDTDTNRLDWLNRRIANLQELARKHHVSVESLPATTLQLNRELNSLREDEDSLDDIELAFAKAQQDYLFSARELSVKRQQTAELLSTQITEVMQQLGMDGGRFLIQVDSLDNPSNYRASGLNAVEYLVSANPGQPLKPLSKVASGGELSRVSLAIQVIMSESSSISTLIFDEVDSGVGGGIAEIVGKKLRLLGDKRQVLCVTHLPQVASQAHHHIRVEKLKTPHDTTTTVSQLSKTERREEIARMLGGLTITDQSRAHASEMMSRRDKPLTSD